MTDSSDSLVIIPSTEEVSPPSSSHGNRLQIASCLHTNTLERDFLNNKHFKLYDVDRDPKQEPFVLYSQSMQKYYVKTDESAISARDLQIAFEDNGHGLTVAYEFSYVRPFALDLDCMFCHGNHSEYHMSELKAHSVLTDVVSFLQKMDKRAVVSIWNLNCGYHIYSNILVSVNVHEQIVNCLNAKYMNDREIVVEMPKFMPLPYSAKIPGIMYKQSFQNDPELDNLIVFYGSARFSYYDNCKITTNRCNDNCIAIETTSGQKFLSFQLNVSRRNNNIPNFDTVTGFQFTDEHQKTKHEKLCVYMERIITKNKKLMENEMTSNSNTITTNNIGSEELSQVVVNYDRLNADEEFMNIIRAYRSRLEEYLLQFNVLYFANSETISIISNDYTLVFAVFDKFIHCSAIHSGGLNLQHYVVSLQKLLKGIPDNKFYYFIRTLYADITNTSVCHFLQTYDMVVARLYCYDVKSILMYLRLYITDKITANMSTSEIFDVLACNRLGVSSPEVFIQKVYSMPSKVQKEQIDVFMNLMVRICEECHLLQYFNEQLYVLNDTMFFYETFEQISFLVNWFNKDITDAAVKSLLKSKAPKFNVSTFCENNEFMVTTSVGMFNTVTGIYSTKTPLVKFNKGRFSVVWPMDRAFVAYNEQNEDILKDRIIANRVVKNIRNNCDTMFVEFLLKPALLSLREVWDITNVQEFMEKLQQHKSLPNMTNMIEYFPFNRQFVVYLLELLCAHGLNILCNYKKLCQIVLMHKKNSKSVSPKDWLENYNQVFRTKYQTDENCSELFTCNDSNETYYKRLSSFQCTYASFENIDERLAIIGITLAAAFTKCQSFRVLCRAFDSADIPEPSWHYKVDDDDDSSVIPVPSIETYWSVYNRAIEKMMIDPDDPFEKRLYIMALQLCMSTNFKEDATREVLNIYSTLMVPINVLKKIYVLFGEQSTGKSHVLNILMELMHPSGHSLNDLEEAQNRAGLASKKLFLRCNELKVLNPSLIKSITGNDPLSTKVFFSQKYELPLSGQAAIFAATNVYVEFREFKNRVSFIDRAVIDRFHTVQLRGKQIHEQSYNSFTDSIFAMIGSDQYFISSTKLSLKESANALQWLMYENYMMTRNKENYTPYIDVDFEDSVNYRHMINKNNNVVYDFLSNCGICEESGFFMMSKTLLRIISRNFTNDSSTVDSGNGTTTLKTNSLVNSMRISTFEKFKAQFKSHYNVDLSNKQNVKIFNFQLEGLVLNIKENLRTEKDENGVILEEDLMRRLKVYMNGVEKENALTYFKRINGPMRNLQNDGQPKRRVLGIRGISFVNPIMDEYDGSDRGECSDDDYDDDDDDEDDDADVGIVASGDECFNDFDNCSDNVEKFRMKRKLLLNDDDVDVGRVKKRKMTNVSKNKATEPTSLMDESSQNSSQQSLINFKSFLKDSI